jgi:hypothetical protein
VATANEATGARHLRSLEYELRDIVAALDVGQREGICEVVTLSDATPDQVVLTFQNDLYRDRIAILHFAGHAGPEGLLFETAGTHWNAAAGRWEADCGAIFNLNTDGRRPETWTSADAAGLAIFPGLIRYDEVYGTAEIRHAFRVTVRATNGYVWPASHRAGSTAGALPMGARLRLKASKNLSAFRPEVQRLFRAMQRYGLIVADNGSDMYITGTFDTRWNNSILNPAFGSLTANDFEVITRGWQPPGPNPPTNVRIVSE